MASNRIGIGNSPRARRSGPPRSRHRPITYAAALGLVMALAAPAIASLQYRDASDQSAYWTVSTAGGSSMQYHSTGGKVCSGCVRPLRESQRSSTTVTPSPSNYALGTWWYSTSATAGEIQAWMTCSGKMTTYDADYYVTGGATFINQNAYCNSWVSVMTSVYIDRYVRLDNRTYNGPAGRKVGWEAIRVYW